MPYKIIRELGRGGFGIVRLVEDLKGRRWAMKSFAAPSLPHVDSADLRARFEREVRYQNEIDHPNVVKIHDFDLKADPPWFVMELATCSLRDELNADRTLGGQPRAPLFDILAGLEALHTKGYKHRDLKPDNVLKFTSSNGKVRYAISDFGLMAPASGQTTTLTSSNMGGGTAHYAAPECVMNFKKATAQSDIYSVGAILHDVFGGGAHRIPHTELSVSGPVGPIIQKCTKQNVRRRYKDVAALREALYEVLSTEAIVFTSQEEEDVVKLIQSKEILTDGEWDRVFQQIDENSDKARSNHVIFRALTVAQITQLATESPELLASLGNDYASYAEGESFDFDYCDVIAGKADIFFHYGELDLKARIALAVLELGTSHNRWFVERKFMTMAGPHISDDLANRMRVEIEAKNIKFEDLILHLEDSISESRDNLHPILRSILP